MTEKQSKKSFWEFFIRNRKFTNIVIIALVVLGIFSVIQIPKESEPDIDIPIAIITVPFPGASAEDVEELVSKPIEDKLLSLGEVESVDSSSRQGLSSIVIQFDVSVDVDKKIEEVKEKVDLVKRELPTNALEPNVSKVNGSDLPVLTMAVSGPFVTQQLQFFAEELKQEVERVTGVSEVQILGGEDLEIQVMIDDRALQQYGLNITQVTRALTTAHTDIPIGAVDTVDGRYAIRLAGRLENVEEIENTPIMVRGNAPILIRDVATVSSGVEPIESLSRLSLDGGEARPAITLRIFKTKGGNVLSVVEDIHTKINEVKDNSFPEELVVHTVEDNAQFIREDLGNLFVNGLQTVGLVMLLLFIFLGWREGLLAGISMPLTFLITFMFLLQIGYTLNFLTLFSLILSLGILVDGAIVVTEGMYTRLNRGMNRFDAAKATIREFKTPLISGTLTTVFAFLPMMLTSGIIGKFIRSIPVTVSIILLVSLVVALGFTTTLGMQLLKPKKNVSASGIVPKKVSIKEKLRTRSQDWYGRRMENLINKPWLRRGMFFVLFLMLLGSISLPVLGILKVNMFPQPDLDTVYIDIKQPVGTIFSKTEESVKKVEDALRADTRVESFSVTVGAGSNAGGANIDRFATHLGNIVVNLKEDREDTSTEIVNEFDEQFNKNTDREQIRISQLSSGPPSSAPVEIIIKGTDLATLEELSKQFEAELNAIDGTRDVRSTSQDKQSQFVIEIDRIKAKLYGVDVQQIAGVLRNAISGSEAISITENGKDQKVIVRYAYDSPIGERNIPNIDPSAIESIRVFTQAGEIPLSSFVEIRVDAVSASIVHADGDRTVSVLSGVKDGVAAQDIFEKMEERLEDIVIPNGYEVRIGGERDDIDQSFTDLFRAMILGIFMIAALLVWQFRSYRQPLFILITIPLALIGILPGLVLVNQSLSFPGFIGVVALAGIVVNNAIILVDRINENRREGLTRANAIILAGKSRLQPIILTTVTTISGMLPLALQNETWGPLGFTIVFGLLFSTILTLFVVPALYWAFAEKEI